MIGDDRMKEGEVVQGTVLSTDGRETIAELVGVGVNPVQPVVTRSVEGPLAGKTLVVTGTLERYARKEIEALMEQTAATLLIERPEVQS